MKTRLGSDANIMVPALCSNTGYMQSCLLYKLNCTGIYVSSAKLASPQHGTDSRHGLRKSHVTLLLHQAWFKSRLCAQMLQFPLHWWKTCIRWRLNNLQNATRGLFSQNWVEIHEFPVCRVQDQSLALAAIDPNIFTVSFISSRRIHS